MYYKIDRVSDAILLAIICVVLYAIYRIKTPRDNTEERRLRKMRREQMLRDWL